MIALLQGQIAFKSIDHIIIDVGGVGYRLHIPLSTFYSLPDEGSVRLQVYTHVREDAILLFGFLTAPEKEMFVKLLSISGIGPKLALNILSHISVGELCDALGQKDVKRLSALPGIGRKTAERLVLELSDKVPRATSSTRGFAAGEKNDPLGDALSALVNLGYKETQARKALESMEITVPVQVSLEEILKGALKILVR